jgi:hypothetical protein
LAPAAHVTSEPAEVNAGPAVTVRLVTPPLGKPRVHSRAADELEVEERERLSDAEPPRGTVAEESAKLSWARKRLLNGNKKTAKRIKLLQMVDIFIKYRASNWLCAKNKASCTSSNPTRLNWICRFCKPKSSLVRDAALWKHDGEAVQILGILGYHSGQS